MSQAPQGPFEIPRLERLTSVGELGGNFAGPAFLQIHEPRTRWRLRLRDGFGDRMLDGFDEEPNVRFPPPIAELDGISKGELGEIGWQVLGGGHRRPFDQDGNHANALVLECGRHLDAQEIVGVIEAPAS